ncbi:hypothetical protein WMY93_001644 [Mugilogobius chulae]|uniref:ribonuclease H n=1 Tax=Mugilogobius chulae TaxID=88201 RepID=A0AAW0PRJ6_9GOBI
MFRPYEREPAEARPQRAKQMPSYLQDYEVSYPVRSRVPEDEQSRHVSSSEIIRSFKHMREENDQLRRDVQRLSDMIHRAPAAPHIRCHNLSTKKKHLTISTYKSADAIQWSPGPTSAMESLRRRLHETRLSEQAQAPDATGPAILLPQSETEVKEAPQPTEQSRYHDDRGSPPRSRSHYQAGESPPRHKSESYDVKPRVTYEKDYDRYADRSSRHEDSHMSYSRAAVPDAYHGPKPTIPDFKSEDPREFARLKLALDNLLPYDASEHFKFQILTDHLKCEEALLIADSYSNSPYPFTDTMRALTEMYGQPQQLALKRISNLMNEPNIRPGDIKAFKSFALQVRALVGMLHQLGHPGWTELKCGSHVSRLLAKLPHNLRADFHRFVNPIRTPIPTLLDLADWLEYEAEELTLRTVRQEVRSIHGASVSFTIAPASEPGKSYKINKAFTARELNLSRHTYPVKALQEKYHHLKDIPLPIIKDAQPLLLIGSDYPHLITPVEPVRLGPPGGPAAVHTRLGWTLQGPTSLLCHQLSPQQCLFTICNPPEAELLKHVEKLWQLDVLPYRSERLITRSRQDAEAVHTLEKKTTRVMVDGVNRYATPLLWKQNVIPLNASKEAVLPQLRGTEKRLVRDQERAAIYSREMHKLIDAGYVKAIAPAKTEECSSSWFIPHHIVQHNQKHRIVFNCSFTFNGQSLNDNLLPGPTLGASLLGVLLRFREHPVAISSDVKGMFHQVRLLEEDKPFLRFLWRDVRADQEPTIYEWQVLPFGTTCSPCCATFALQTHVQRHTEPEEDARLSVERCFYVDNCLQSLQSQEEAKQLHTLVHTGKSRPPGAHTWTFVAVQIDTLRYKQHRSERPELTMRNIYRLLAQQYDPLGYIIPYTTRAKIIVQRLWDKKRGWDDPNLPEELLQAWRLWEEELPHLSQITLPRCYTSHATDCSNSSRTIHVFCDASERAYGSVAYLRTDSGEGDVQVAFLAARSRVAPKKQLSIPRLELCGALTGAQLASVLIKELTVQIQAVVYWTDSTTVLHWLQSDSCRYKVFVGTRVAEVQELTDINAWRYIDSASNPADDITRGKTLTQLTGESRWSHGPSFLLQSCEQWPEKIASPVGEETEELRSKAFCGLVTPDPVVPDVQQFNTYKELLDATTQKLHGAADKTSLTADDYQKAEIALLKYAQAESFPEEVSLLQSGKPLSSTSRLLTLSPEYDSSTSLVRVGGRLRRCDALSPDVLHPILLSSSHPVSKLLIQHYDDQLRHPGAERVFAELRRKYWILRGREAVKKHQHNCVECRKWRGTPQVPKMADLPPSRLRLFKPAFYSTGVDCFGPMLVKVGRRTEKRWGILYKCLTTRAIHLDLLPNMDSDSFLMSLRRFIARRGKPYELLSDQGTNFKGGSRELREAFLALEPTVKEQLSSQQIRFQFNPPNAPHFGGSWEREVRSVKTALRTTLGDQSVPDEVLRTLSLK